MAEADNKTTTSRVLTLPQAVARIGHEELQLALEEGRLLAKDMTNWSICDELHRCYRHDLKLRGVPRGDLDALHAISRRLPIPPQAWWRWFADGSVNWQTGEIVRSFFDRGVVIFLPILLSADVLAQVPADPAAQTIGIADQLSPKAAFIRWLEKQVSQLKAEGKLPDRITDCAKLLEARLSGAADSDKTLRRVKARHIENTLRACGLFPKKRSK